MKHITIALINGKYKWIIPLSKLLMHKEERDVSYFANYFQIFKAIEDEKIDYSFEFQDVLFNWQYGNVFYELNYSSHTYIYLKFEENYKVLNGIWNVTDIDVNLQTLITFERMSNKEQYNELLSIIRT